MSSWQKKQLLKVAEVAATESMMVERGRCLWILDQIEHELNLDLSKRLITPAQQQAIAVRMQIARALFSKLRVAIVSGARPAQEPR